MLAIASGEAGVELAEDPEAKTTEEAWSFLEVRALIESQALRMCACSTALSHWSAAHSLRYLCHGLELELFGDSLDDYDLG
jgi:hypothetical protein